MTANRHICAGFTLLLLMTASAQNPVPTALPVGSATVAEFKGEVELHSPHGDMITPQRGATLAPESKIDTKKGSLLLDLQDGSQVFVKPNSNLVLKVPTEGKGYWLELLLGKINAKVQKRLGNAPSFRMGTPTAVITVRGTRFAVDVDKKQRTHVEVFEGLVEVAGFFHGAPVMVRPGFSTGVDLDRDPEQPHGIDHRENENRWNPGAAPGVRNNEDDREKQGTRPPPANSGSPQHEHEPE